MCWNLFGVILTSQTSSSLAPVFANLSVYFYCYLFFKQFIKDANHKL